MKYPLVSVICLCYNHERFLREALDSVLAQTYPHLEIIVADDASTDTSAAIIREYCARYPRIKFIQNTQNKGNCKTFNQAFAQSAGAYIVDFATDDVLLPNRIAEQINCFAALDETFGIVYTDALLIDENSAYLRHFYKILTNSTLFPLPVSGWVYTDLVKRFFISAPTMLIKRTVLEKLDGYNETLAYEDFDFWVRSSRYFKYYFLNKALTKRRLHSNQLSRQLYKKQDKQLASTVHVCYLALSLNRTDTENMALVSRVQYELRKAFLTGNCMESSQLLELLKQLKALKGIYKLVYVVVHGQLTLNKFLSTRQLKLLP